MPAINPLITSTASFIPGQSPRVECWLLIMKKTWRCGGDWRMTAGCCRSNGCVTQSEDLWTIQRKEINLIGWKLVNAIGRSKLRPEGTQKSHRACRTV